MALECQSVLSVRFLHTYVLLLIFSEAQAVHESEILYQSLCQNSHSENDSSVGRAFYISENVL